MDQKFLYESPRFQGRLYELWNDWVDQLSLDRKSLEAGNFDKFLHDQAHYDLEARFKRLADEFPGPGDYFLSIYLHRSKRSQEANVALSKSSVFGFNPAFVRQVQFLCEDKGYARLSAEQLQRLKRCSEEGILRARKLYLQNNDKDFKLSKILTIVFELLLLRVRIGRRSAKQSPLSYCDLG